MSYLIDTNIIIYRLKNRGMVNEHFEKHRDEDMYISSIVYGELVYGAKKSMYVEKNLATALENDLTLVTHNTKHFNHIPRLELEDWF